MLNGHETKRRRPRKVADTTRRVESLVSSWCGALTEEKPKRIAGARYCHEWKCREKKKQLTVVVELCRVKGE